MNTHLVVTLAVIVMFAVAGAASVGAPWLEPARYGDLRIVVAESASPSEQTAGTEFRKYWEQCTGHKIPISTAPGEGAVNVWIGRIGVPDSLLSAIELEGLGDDGLCIRTLGSKDLLIVGGQKRGTLYGVYQFFEDYMGIRWLAPDVTYVPPVCNALLPIAFRYVPPLRYRDTDYWMFTWHPEFAVKHRFNGDHMFRIPEQMGGNVEFANALSNTLFSFVHPDEYGQTHPEYFSEINGKRITNIGETQLCLTNPDVLRIAIDKTLRLLRNGPADRRIVSIAQMQSGAFCDCGRCRAVNEREGSQSGTMIRFVNQVAEAIEGEFPDAFIETLAYAGTRKPPKALEPRDNVIVKLCAAECDFSEPLADSARACNKAFRKDLRKWSAITRNFSVWDYTQNRYCFQQPNPNFHVLQPNVAFFVENGVTGLFAQGAKSPHSDFDMLKAYILSHSIWNPAVKWEALYSEFIDLYYGAAAPYIREYLDLVGNRVRDTGSKLTISNDLDWMTCEIVGQAEELFRRAFAAVDDEDVRQRLYYAHLPVQHAALVCPPHLELTGDSCVVSRPPSLTFDEYWDMIMRYGVTHNGDGPIMEFRDRLGGQTPPRRQEVQVQKLENAYWEVWLARELSGAVITLRDKRAGIDWFSARDALSKGSHMLQEWHIMDPEKPMREEPIGTPYEITARTGDSIAFETRLDNGLVVRRATVLEPGSKAVEMVFEVENTGPSPLVPRVKPHPEFWVQGDYAPELWIERNGRWQEHEGSAGRGQRVGIGIIEPQGVTRWALHIPDKHVTLINTVRPEELQNLLFYFNLDNQTANLEAYPLLTPLEPGEKRRVHLSYTMSRKRPDRL